MYDGDRLSKKETSILPKTCKFIEIGDASYRGSALEGEYASTADMTTMLVKTAIDNPKYANIPGTIKCN